MTETMKIDAAAVEFGVIRYFDYAGKFAIPNVTYGFGLSYEVDVMIVTKFLYAYEIEIKVSPGDLKRDCQKWRFRQGWEPSQLFRKSYYAMPVEMEKYTDLIPSSYGVLLVKYNNYWFEAREVRPAATNASARKLTETEYANLGRLCMLRMWDLKKTIWQYRQNRKAEAEGAYND